jgi:hypothetical protein
LANLFFIFFYFDLKSVIILPLKVMNSLKSLDKGQKGGKRAKPGDNDAADDEPLYGGGRKG